MRLKASMLLLPLLAVAAAATLVDRDTDAMSVERYVTVSDAGRAINPAGVEGQDLGDAMTGLGPRFGGRPAVCTGSPVC